jgi:N6-adenosine-specific RNA methylase IME4
MSNEDIAALPVLDIAAADAHLYLWTTNQHLWAARDVCLGWGFEPSQVLTWCKPQDRVSPGGGLFFGTTEFVIYARRSHGGGERLVKRAGAMIREAREREGLSRGDLHRLIRGGNPTGIVHRWENDDCLPNDRDWVLLLEVLGIRHMFSKPTVPQRDRSESRVPTTWFQWPRGAHSAKPAAFLDIVERVSPGPYVELFARAPRLGWDSWGHGYEIGATA